MIIYWSMFAIPAFFAALLYKSNRNFSLVACFLILIAFFFIMAFRETGGDFYTYNLFYKLFDGSSLFRLMAATDSLYGAVNWISMQFGWEIYGVNAICAAIFLFSFYKFARHEPYPLLSLTVAAAYLIVVVAIGYTRQGVAAGLLLWGTVYLRTKQPWKYLALQILAIGFHTSSAFAIVLIYFALNIENKAQRQLVFLGLLSVCVVSVFTLQGDILERYVDGYIESDRYSSDGAFSRLAMSFVAAGLFLSVRKAWPKSDRDIWACYALMTLALFPVLLISSTAADRLGLYTIALQVAVFGRLPMFAQTVRSKTLLFAGSIAMYAIVLGVWLHVGNFAKVLWLPYKSLIFGVFQ